MFKLNHTKAKFLGMIIIALAIALAMEGINFSWRTALANFMYTLIYWEGSWQITGYFRKRYNSYELTSKRILFQSLSILLYVCITNFFLCYLLTILINPNIQLNWKLYTSTLQLSLIVTFLISTIYEAQNFFDLWKKSKLEAEQLKQQNLIAQFETLKNQVNPHFLFNSLNTLAAIIPENPEQAVVFVEKLSSLYRYILQFRDKDVVDLKTELQNIRAYLYLQEMRFGDNLKWEINVPENLMSSEIPPLSLQVLAENAVKHNIISNQKPLLFEIYTEGRVLKIRNTLQTKQSTEASTMVGLSNLQERLRLLHHKELLIEQDDKHFTVSLTLKDQ